MVFPPLGKKSIAKDNSRGDYTRIRREGEMPNLLVYDRTGNNQRFGIEMRVMSKRKVFLTRTLVAGIGKPHELWTIAYVRFPFYRGLKRR
jgi:hypothetical protein